MSVERNNRRTTNRGKRRGPPMRAPALADYLNVSLSWVFKRTMSEEIREKYGIREALPCYYLGGILVFDREEIDQWLKKQPRRRQKRNRQTIFAALEEAQGEKITGGLR